MFFLFLLGTQQHAEEAVAEATQKMDSMVIDDKEELLASLIRARDEIDKVMTALSKKK